MAVANILQYEPGVHRHLLPQIVDLHARCIEFDGALLRFHPPFSEEKKKKMQSFWEQRISQVEQGLRICFIYSVIESGKEEIGGIAELGMPAAETGPFRGDVEMVIVSPNHRRQGIAKLLMVELERVARERGRTLLVRASIRTTFTADRPAIVHDRWLSSC